MIPFIYKLRKSIRFEKKSTDIDDGSRLIISEIPLNISRVSKRAVNILKLCNGKTNIAEIAKIIKTDEENIFKICNFFNKKAVLETIQANNKYYFPSVTVIIPTKDRESETIECLRSVLSQHYPQNKLEVIVVDDGSQNRNIKFNEIFPCKVIQLDKNHGQSHCRNLGAGKARGEILAFLDSDCVADKNWLKDLVVYFQWSRIGAVGGFVDGYFEDTFLDRYEKKFSSLNMGKYQIYGSGTNSTFYTPTCNLLVRKKVYQKAGGINKEMRLGEDVDLCWKIRELGNDMLYVPHGIVKHKHRNILGRMLKRRSEYGTSEAILYGIHGNKRKRLRIPPIATIGFLGLSVSILSLSWLPVIITAACYLLESAIKSIKITEQKIKIPLWKIFFSVLRVHFSFFYIISFHLIRYYMLLFIITGFFYYPIWLLCLFMILISSSVDYFVKKPKLIFPVFLFYYLAEHVSYQAGVFWGCLKAKSFKSYRTEFFMGMNN